ncbi:hypothetical protein F5148DRAFT_736389 [Russula earlei]|uniref:Uncharacterized protein n=1 Tax=Russula earlei TaxID=71964 RepID=A0ACC0TUY7_9AGAM|nr:hypothetical protein F5148DRAFT_736389 [Russula earlei]
MSSSSTLPSSGASSSLLSPTPSIVEGVNQLAWQAPVFFIVVLVIVAIITGTILLIWNDHRVPSIRPRLIMRFIASESPFLLFPGTAIISSSGTTCSDLGSLVSFRR